MGTTLTGTTPQDTYDSLIKVTDNGPLSATVKYLSDGLGNDSALAMSTSRVGVNTASPTAGLEVITDGSSLNALRVASSRAYNLSTETAIVFRYLQNTTDYVSGALLVAAKDNTTINNQSGNLQFYTNNAGSVGERMRITSDGNVGIGTSTPLAKLNVADAALSTLALTATGEATDQKTWVYQYGAAVGAGTFRLRASNDAVTNGQNAVIITRTGFNVDTHQFLTSGSERFRITDNGVTFNGDTAAANALDDYEEGTWTPVIRGSSTAGTYELSTAVAAYTKVGRQVTVTAQVTTAASVTGGGSGYAQITGLPFTNSSQAVGAIYVSSVDFSGSYLTVAFISSSGQNTIYFVETNDNAVAADLPISVIGGSRAFNFTLTYFV